MMKVAGIVMTAVVAVTLQACSDSGSSDDYHTTAKKDATKVFNDFKGKFAEKNEAELKAYTTKMEEVNAAYLKANDEASKLPKKTPDELKEIKEKTDAMTAEEKKKITDEATKVQNDYVSAGHAFGTAVFAKDAAAKVLWGPQMTGKDTDTKLNKKDWELRFPKPTKAAAATTKAKTALRLGRTDPSA